MAQTRQMVKKATEGKAPRSQVAKNGPKAGKSGKGQAARAAPVEKTHKYKPGAAAPQDLGPLAPSPGLEIPKDLFLRLVREVVDEFKPDIRFTDQALEALHQAAGAMLFYAVLDDAQSIATNAKRVIIQPRDYQLAKRLRGDRD